MCRFCYIIVFNVAVCNDQDGIKGGSEWWGLKLLRGCLSDVVLQNGGGQFSYSRGNPSLCDHVAANAFALLSLVKTRDMEAYSSSRA